MKALLLALLFSFSANSAGKLKDLTKEQSVQVSCAVYGLALIDYAYSKKGHDTFKVPVFDLKTDQAIRETIAKYAEFKPAADAPDSAKVKPLMEVHSHLKKSGRPFIQDCHKAYTPAVEGCYPTYLKASKQETDKCIQQAAAKADQKVLTDPYLKLK